MYLIKVAKKSVNDQAYFAFGRYDQRRGEFSFFLELGKGYFIRQSIDFQTSDENEGLPTSLRKVDLDSGFGKCVWGMLLYTAAQGLNFIGGGIE